MSILDPIKDRLLENPNLAPETVLNIIETALESPAIFSLLCMYDAMQEPVTKSTMLQSIQNLIRFKQYAQAVVSYRHKGSEI